MSLKTEPECPFFMETCFAYRKNEYSQFPTCSILEDTNFKKRDVCPFYKPREEYEKGK